MNHEAHKQAERRTRERYLERLLRGISEPNQGAARDFLQIKEGQGRALQTRILYAHSLELLDRSLNGTLWDGCTDREAAQFLTDLRRTLAPHTVRTSATYAKAFLAWHLRVAELPPRLRFAFSVSRPPAEPDLGRLVSDDAFAGLMKGLEGRLMQQALAGLLWEAGFRISEALSLHYGSVNPDDRNGARISLPRGGWDQKTGPRTVYVAKYAGLLDAWMRVHEHRSDTHAPLFYCEGTGNHGMRSSKHYVYRTWTRAFLATGTAPFTPHDLRHTAATRDGASGMNEFDLNDKYGWHPKSGMASHYVKIQAAHREAVARRSVGIGPDGLPLSATRLSEDQVEKRIRAALRRLLSDEPKAAPE